MIMATRGTSNGNQSGSSYSRRRRREWLLETYRADVDLIQTEEQWVAAFEGFTYWATLGGWTHPDNEHVILESLPDPSFTEIHGEPGSGTPACRCYRCGKLLTAETLTVDRIIPGCQGGTYRRNNIRPACGTCNSETGGRTRRKKRFTS